ncbi:MarR family transcriptional regulator [Paraburkholderia phytofirmans OLGA172]|uniref:MarR family transcriptional regulator n=1 Tax=Paraburkholderia phytofirmans OLGA172 TaxID=1417228 RepID=A0A160FSI0_9BURK|nr:MarR family winged helix-turn-helix transcriptional regulator [Paraburkholderia phytofirmans]ANB75871.1 MarR family transcriptional regulator [Paraburkholderia phytofirmans OLGA172]
MDKNVSHSECNCFALRQAARYVTQVYDRHLSQAGVTPAQFTIMAHLARHPRMTMVELTEAIVMERTSLLRALKPLQRDGLVDTEASAHDARAHVFRLTRSGTRTLSRARPAWLAAQAEFESKFGSDRAKALRAELFDMTTA